jgi:hypothetical protein
MRWRLFDPNKPYFEAWRQIHDRYDYSIHPQCHLYHAALHGFYDIVQHLINRHPEQVTGHDRTSFSPLVGALISRTHVRVAELLVKHGAHVHIRGDPPLCYTISYSKSDDGRVNAVQFLLKHGARVNAGSWKLMTPLHCAASAGSPEVARILLEHGADMTLRNDDGQVPLHLVSDLGGEGEGECLVLARLLLVGSCTDVNAKDLDGATPLHRGSYNRRPRIFQLLLDHEANAHAEDNQGRNPLHQMSKYLRVRNGPSLEPKDVVRVTQLLLKQGVDINVLDRDHETPLHIAA